MNYNVFYTYRPENTAWTPIDQRVFNDFIIFRSKYNEHVTLLHCNYLALTWTKVYTAMLNLRRWK